MNAVTPLPLANPTDKQSETTRLLCADVFLGHDDDIRKKFYAYVINRYHSVADNHGLNTRLLARVLDFYYQKQLRYLAWHGPVGLISFLILAIALSTANEDMQVLMTILVIITAVIFAVPAYRHHTRNRYDYALRNFARDNFDARRAMEIFANSHGELESHIAASEASPNACAYSGFQPFVGAGESVGDWSLLIDTRKGKNDGSTIRFTSQELERSIAAAFHQLSLPELQLGERLYVHGEDVSLVEGLLPDRFARPRRRVSEDTLARFRQNDSREARVYQFVEVAGWADQVCISFFYRATFRGPMLYVETHARVLQPVAVGYRGIDNISVLKAGAKIALLFAYTVGAPFVCLADCIRLLTLARVRGEARKSEAEEKARLEEQARFNYGAIKSLRESFAASIYDHFFEKSDRDLYVKTLQRQLLDSIVNFLDSRHVDTSDLRDQRSYIINSGLIVQGDLQAGAIAVGDAAKANAGSVKRTKVSQAAAGGTAT